MTSVRPLTGTQLLIRRSERTVLNIESVRLGIEPCTAIVGPNGAGKSLLIKTMAALVKPDSGQVRWAHGAPDIKRRLRVGLLLQRPVLLRRTSLQNMIYALRVAGISPAEAKPMALNALEYAGLGELVDTFAHQLSGGEQQRLALARALLLKPDMLLLDEATANVDPASTLAIEQQLRAAIAEGLCVAFVSHDVGQVKRLANEVILMHNGQIVEQSSRLQFFEHSTNPVTLKWLAGEILV